VTKPADPRRLRMLAEKGRRLFARACDGASCAEGFAAHHLRCGDHDVVRDFIAFLEAELERLRGTDPGRAEVTRALVERIRARLADSPGS